MDNAILESRVGSELQVFIPQHQNSFARRMQHQQRFFKAGDNTRDDERVFILSAAELDSFDGRRDPERCNSLVNKLRVAQDRVLHIIGTDVSPSHIKINPLGEMLCALFPREADRACRDFRVKFPDEIVHDNLPGQLWFGAECLAAGSNIIDHEQESEDIRPLAREVTRHLDGLRDLLKVISGFPDCKLVPITGSVAARPDRLYGDYKAQLDGIRSLFC